jgi:enterochelin esterase-like enzyme
MALLFATACTDDKMCCTVNITITVPDDTSEVFLAGNVPELGPWSPVFYAMQGSGNERSAELLVPEGTELEYKFTLGSWDREAVDAAGAALSNFRLSVDGDRQVHHEIRGFKPDPIVFIEDWRGSGVQGTLVYWTDVSSEFLGPARHVSIWLPPGYDQGRDVGYPVLYMHDGKALFDPRLGGGAHGNIWDVDDAIMRLVEQEKIPPLIVVGVWNSEERITEYSPWHDAPNYARFLIEELMPRVNADFNTATGPEATAVMGSSMGGLLSYYLVTYQPDVFGSCGCVSSAFILSEALTANWVPTLQQKKQLDETPYIVRDIEAGLEVPEGVRYWFDHGTVGGDAGYDIPHRKVRAWLLEQGLEEGDDFVIRVYEGADHNEAAWRDRLEDPLLFLYGERSLPAD